MQKESNSDRWKEIRARHDELPNNTTRISESSRTHNTGSLYRALGRRQGQQSHRHSNIKKFLVRTIIVVILSSLIDDWHINCSRKQGHKHATSTTSKMVLSLSFAAITQRRPMAVSTLPVILQRTGSSLAILTIRPRMNSNDHRFRLFSSEIDKFFGGDIDRLVGELSSQQEDQEQRANKSQFVKDGTTQPCWRDALDLSVEEKRDGDNSFQQISSPSPVEIRTIRGRTVHVKHDDQLRLSGSGISGNKARKMWTLNEIPARDFPSYLVSYGGPQSNSMVALAAIVNCKNRELLEEESSTATSGFDFDDDNDDDNDDNDDDSVALNTKEQLPLRFVYYAKKLPRFLRKQPNGNLFRALSLGMDLMELSNDEYKDLFQHHSDDSEGAPVNLEPPGPNSLWVPQGGAFAPARVGAQRLAQEIYTYWLESGNSDKPLTVCVPGGTCTTALLLHHSLSQLLRVDSDTRSDDGSNGWEYDDDDEYQIRSSSTMDIEVVVVPCVGDASYARRQMRSLSVQIGAPPDHIPTILQPKSDTGTSGNPRKDKYFTFGKPNKKILETFHELQDGCNLVVDLIYGAPAFSIMWRHWGGEESTLSPDLTFDPNQPLEGREIMYVHSGGLEGINSQLLRYKYEGLVEVKDVQLPGREKRTKHKKK